MDYFWLAYFFLLCVVSFLNFSSFHRKNLKEKIEKHIRKNNDFNLPVFLFDLGFMRIFLFTVVVKNLHIEVLNEKFKEEMKKKEIEEKEELLKILEEIEDYEEAAKIHKEILKLKQ